MGQACFTNVSRLASRLVRRQDGANFVEIVDELVRTKQVVRCSHGILDEREDLAWATEEYLGWLHGHGLVKPLALTSEQGRVLAEWAAGKNDKWTYGEGGDRGQFGIFDSIRWTANGPRLPLIHAFHN